MLYDEKDGWGEMFLKEGMEEQRVVEGDLFQMTIQVSLMRKQIIITSKLMRLEVLSTSGVYF